MRGRDYHDTLKELSEIGASVDHRRLFQVFGQRYVVARTLLKERRVKRYVFHPSGLVLWVVVGGGREYVICPAVGFCNCEDYFFRIRDGDAQACEHLIAQRLAESLGWFDTIEARGKKPRKSLSWLLRCAWCWLTGAPLLLRYRRRLCWLCAWIQRHKP